MQSWELRCTRIERSSCSWASALTTRVLYRHVIQSHFGVHPIMDASCERSFTIERLPLSVVNSQTCKPLPRRTLDFVAVVVKPAAAAVGTHIHRAMSE
jgi:hypothetical protein